MEDILDSIRKIIGRWVQTNTIITEDVSVGDTTVTVRSSIRFNVNDEVMIKGPLRAYETELIIESVPDNTHVTFTSPILNPVETSENPVLIKTINQMFVQGIYIGDPEVISHYPAITVNGKNRNSEWLTFDSTKERYDLEINVYVLESTQEKGYRFLLQMVKEIEKGLKKNIFPLIGDYDTVSLLANIEEGDTYVKVNDSSDIINQKRITIENQFIGMETWVSEVLDANTIVLSQSSCYDFDKDYTTIIVPSRFIYNSWPSDTEYGLIHKGDLLKAASIKWFGEEEEIQLMRKQNPNLS